MKTKDKTAILREKIMKYFVLCSFGVAVIESALDSTFDDIISPILYPNPKTDYRLYDVPHIIYIMICLSLYVVGAIVFYRLTSKALKEESERRVKEQNLLYAAIAHDLKTPMTSVQGFAKALSDGKIKTEEQQEIFDIIYRKSNSMNDMVNTLFDYAKLGTEGYMPHMTQIDVCTLVRDIVAENYCDFEEHGIEPEIDIPDTPIMITGDKTELKRAVSNLIVNIYKHNPDGIKARIFVGNVGGKAEIKIADSGNELPTDVDIFEPFITENTARTLGHGTGLGLAITKRILNEHNAKIYISDTIPDYAKAFVVDFPIA